MRHAKAFALIVLGLAALAYWYSQNHPFAISNLRSSATDKLGGLVPSFSYPALGISSMSGRGPYNFIVKTNGKRLGVKSAGSGRVALGSASGPMLQFVVKDNHLVTTDGGKSVVLAWQPRNHGTWILRESVADVTKRGEKLIPPPSPFGSIYEGAIVSWSPQSPTKGGSGHASVVETIHGRPLGSPVPIMYFYPLLQEYKTNGMSADTDAKFSLVPVA